MNHTYAKELYLLRRRCDLIEQISSIVDRDDFDFLLPDPEIQNQLDKIEQQYKDVMNGPKFIKELQSIHADLMHGCNNATAEELPLDT